MIIDEEQLLATLKNARKVLLLEPMSTRKYLPLALAKIATYVKKSGGDVVFQRDYRPCNEDVVCVTSVFTYDSGKVMDAIEKVKSSCFLDGDKPVIVGGVFASLMPDVILAKYPDVKVFVGYSKMLDITPPDYSIDWQLKPKWNKFSYIFTTRGCPNRCAYCAVWRIEPEQWINPHWKECIDMSRPYIMISDNNFSSQSSEHIADVCDFVAEHKKRVVFDNGLDCKHITPELADKLSKINFVRYGLRLAFDRIEEDGVFQNAILTLRKAGIPKSKLMAYVLFNFNDTPEEAVYRMRECLKLGIRPYPTQFTPLNQISRKDKFVGKHWTKRLARAFRFFYLMAGYYLKHDFMEWVTSPRWMKEMKLSESDINCLQFAKEKQGKTLKALDLFCGLGGWSDGLSMEDFNVLGVEIEPKIAKLYKHEVICADVTTLDGSKFKGYDLIVGSPPCRDFTILNDARWKIKKNPQNGLKNVNAFLKFVEEAQPKYWLMENVVGLEKHVSIKPKVSKAPIGKYMKRSFWGNFPSFLIPCDLSKFKMRETSGWPFLMKWKRAKIPHLVARALGKAVRDSLEERTPVRLGGVQDRVWPA